MILYREEPYPIQMRNVMLLDDFKSGGVVYVNKTTYDQALLLSGRLDGDPKRVLDILRSPKTEAYRVIMGLKGLIDEMMSSMPKPINMLAPFLALCAQNQGITWDATDRVFAYGILHQFSLLVDFNAITLVPVEVRNNITVATTVLKEYETSWNDLCSSLKDNVVLGQVQQVVQAPVQVQPQVQQVVPVQPQPQPVQTVATPAQQVATPVSPAPQPANAGEMSVEDRIKAFQEKMAREAEQDEKERKAKATKRAAEQPAPKKSEPKPVEKKEDNEAAQSSKVLDEFDCP